jgi:hypothetical protein
MYGFLFVIASLFLTAPAWAQPVTLGASVQRGPARYVTVETRAYSNDRNALSAGPGSGEWLEALRREAAPDQLVRVSRVWPAGEQRFRKDGYAPRQGVFMRVNKRIVARLGGQRVIDPILVAWAEDEDIDTELRRLVEEHRCQR